MHPRIMAMFFIFALMCAFGAASASTGPESTCRRLFERMDLSRPALATVRQQMEACDAILQVVRDGDGRPTGVELDARSISGRPAVRPDGLFDQPGADRPAQTTPITVPAGFRWQGTGKRLMPEYGEP